MSSDLEKRLTALSPEKLALLQKRMKKGQPVAIPKRRRAELVPLSFAQERLWFLEQLQPLGSVYNLPAQLRIRKPVNVAALGKSLDEIVRRHEILRSRFVVADGKPMQEVQPPMQLGLPLIDLADRSPQIREAEAQQLAYMDTHRPYDLSTGALFRASLLRLADNDFLLLLSMHHIVGDAWSLGLLFEELAQLYEAFDAGQPSGLPELQMQYGDYASWQREWLQGAVLEEQLSYWQQQLTGAPPLLTIPADRPRPPVQSFRGAVQHFTVPPNITPAALGQLEGTTLFMTLLAAFSVLLYRYTDQDDIVVGSPIDNRNHPEFERLIGFFTNTLPLRISMAGNPSMREVLRRVKNVALGAYAHQDVPFEKLVETLRPGRSLGHNPLFQVMFVLQHQGFGPGTAWDERMSAGPAAEATRPARDAGSQQAAPATLGTAKFDLTLVITEAPGGLFGSLEYNTDLFDPATAARLAAHFCILLENLAANPDQPIARVPFLLTQERELLEAWSGTQWSAPFRDVRLQEMFEEHAGRNPRAVAVTFAGKGLSYRDLNRRANRLAHYLQSLGVGPEVLVGICFHRSLEMIVGILAVLKAGGAYVPLDPRYPKHRLVFMLADARVSILLTQSDLTGNLPEDGARTVCVGTGDDFLAGQPDHNPPCRGGPDNLAYVIYTSGSTGKPKGVAITHAGLAHISQAFIAISGSNPGTRTLQFSSLSFDASVLEIATSLAAGGTLCLAPSGRLLPGPNLARQIRDDDINAAILPPSALVQTPAEELSSLAFLLAGGEPCTAEIAAKWLPGRTFFNGYGPTEVTICATVFTFQSPWRVPPIGRPLPGKRVYVLDRHLKRVPIGVPGELCVGGIGLARGYLGRPSLTAERFVPDPYGGDAGDRLYKTGDLARYLIDGNIEFIGRADNQVKLRGYRIELDEIQAMLIEHAAVRDSVVIVRDDMVGGERLVAYVVPGDGQAFDVAQLRRHLQDRLPDYMVPSAFVILDAFPLTPNGKIDRQALPEPQKRRSDSAHTYVAPRTAVEKAFAEIWGQVLRVDPVGIHDNFFDLGGHSLLMTQVASRVRSRLHLDLPLRRLMETPTIAELVSALSQSALPQEPLSPPIPPRQTTIPRLPREIRAIQLPGHTSGHAGPGIEQ